MIARHIRALDPPDFLTASAAGLCLLLPLLAASCGAAGPADSTENSTVLYKEHPGAAPYPEGLRDKLLEALAARGADYEPRTHHLTEDGRPHYTNRLILEDSPYLLQHAHNPVDWYPWGPEAFERAKAEDKPIFLSIGYSTCHWCHVMERESFEDAEIAQLMNEYFVCIKIDRERRPDIDEFYMTAVHVLGQRGGWPMSSFLTPDGEPFFGGTYFPPPRFADLLQRVHATWNGQRDQLVQQARQITERVKRATAARGQAAEVGREALEKAVTQIVERHDPELGGFGKAPKFPHEPELLFLLARSQRHGDQEAQAVAEHSLDAMARGGIYDQVGGGFHRYSTDAHWLVPHFEKMLYNQAHLARAYLAAYRLTAKPFYARIARQTLDYSLREMTAPEGGFYSATDADSSGVEGEFFVWTPDALRAALDDEDAKLAMQLWGVTAKGNFEGKNILHLAKGFETFAAEQGLELDALLARVDRIRDQLWRVRETREHPLRDDKIVTAWNGMMITALAVASEILEEPAGSRSYRDAAVRAADFLWAENRRGPGELWRVHLEGSSSIPALQEDYAYLTEAFVTLYDVTGEARWLERARELADAMSAKFWDDENGGFYMTGAGVDPHLLARPKSPNDGAIPSGNSVAVRALAMLAARTGERAYSDRATATLSAFASSIARYPAGFAYMLAGADELLHGGVGPRQYAAAGTVRALGRVVRTDIRGDKAFKIEVDLSIRDGWHVNSDRPLSAQLIATALTIDPNRGGWALDDVDYPPPDTVRLGFQDEPLNVFQGDVTLKARAIPGISETAVVPLRLKIQACDDRVCLKPEELVLEVPVAGTR